MSVALPSSETGSIQLQLRPVVNMSHDEFFEFCQLNRKLRIERTAEGNLIIMPPAGGETGHQNILIATFLTNWALQDDTGVAFDSSTGFTLPNGATRSPDAAWVRRTRLASLTPAQKKKFLPLCPDFVIELRSPSDNLKTVQEKMQEYIANGAQLGFLLDPLERRVYLYRPGAPVVCLENPTTVSGDPELSGFTLDLTRIWEEDF
ncbi:MAG: Uma2 family endonuclease [Candidatus Binatia bacterium]